MDTKVDDDLRPPQAGDLRREAERRLQDKGTTPAEGMVDVDARALVHELQVHQIELEMQNEELLHAQAAVQEVSDKYRDLFDFAPIGYFRLDGQGQILEINLAGAALLGIDRSTAVKQRLGQHVAIPSRARFAELLKGVLQTDRKQACEIELQRNERLLYAVVEGVPAHDGTASDSLRVIVTDITERKRAEQEITRLASFPMLDPHPVVEVDMDGCVCFANPAAQRLFPDLQQLGPDHPWLSNWGSMTNACRERSASVAARDVAIGERHYHQAMYYVAETGRVRIYGEDITERKQAEEELKVAKEAAEKANHAKDHFLAVLSHELRTPLTPVVMGVSILQDRPDLDPGMREMLETIRRNIEMETRLIDDLLDVTRIARGKIELNRGPVELRTVIDRAIEVCMPDIEARRLEFGVDWGPAASYWIEADVPRLQQVFWNLLRNAIKFTPHEGCVGIRCWPDGTQVAIEVNDSGIGIEPEALPRVFDAFEQVEQSITRQFGGLGLGLAICKALVEMHGGIVEAQSEGKGKGATFRVRLPLTAPVSQPEASPPATPRQHVVRPLHVLLVEDHGVTAKLMRMVLTSHGHSVELASDVATALELADQHSFDLLVSDLGLPDGSGHDLMRRLREGGHRFPGIALSGYGQEEDIQRSLEAGFAAHLTKPASREAFVDAVTAVTAGEMQANVP